VSDALRRIRIEYEAAGIEPDDLPDDPMEAFSEWLDAAVVAGIPEPNICHVATVDADGTPSVRAVLIKGLDAGIVFFTNYASRKGRALDADPRAAMNVLWQPLHRQVRFEGRAARIAAAESDAYFLSRPEAARRGAAASPQSEVIPDRAWLEARLADADPSRRPEQWGGYRLVPSVVEFWQGREGRLHDRVRYRRAGTGWVKERLAP
jgi:pyridoxamine 5'-phosphate oxidase